MDEEYDLQRSWNRRAYIRPYAIAAGDCDEWRLYVLQGSIAICLSWMAPEDCDIHNAVDWITALESQVGLAACMIHGQEYVSNARLIQPSKTYPKSTACRRRALAKRISGKNFGIPAYPAG